MIILVIVLIIVFIVYDIRKKRNNSVKFPKTLVGILTTLIVVSIVMSIIRSHIESKTNKMLEESNYNKVDSISLTSLDFNGIKFNYPNSWLVEKKVIQEKLIFQVSVESNQVHSGSICVVVLSKKEAEPTETILSLIESIKQPLPNSQTTKDKIYTEGKIYDITYNGLKSKSMDYYIESEGKTYGNITCFNNLGNTILVLKQSNLKTKLVNDFIDLEKSLKID